MTETVDGYQLVAGERRLRAAQAAGLDRIPAIVRQLADREQLELALVENLQREDLDPLETAEAYRQLIDEFGLSQERGRGARRAGPSTVANTLRLLDLAPGVQAAVADGRLAEGHGRALGGLAADSRIACSTRSSARSSRSARPRSSCDGCASPGRNRSRAGRPADAGARARRGGPASRARHQGEPGPVAGGGRIVIEYYSDEELGRLYERLTGGNA